jgi:hypothetical protein
MPRPGDRYQLGEKLVTVLKCHDAACLVKAQTGRGRYLFWVSSSLLTNPIAPAGHTKA